MREDQQPGINGGSPFELARIYSLSIEDTMRVTGWCKNVVYEEIGSGRLETYKRGKRRYVVAASLLARLAELRAVPAPLTPVPTIHGKGGRPRGLRQAQSAKKPGRPMSSRSKSSGESQFAGLGQPP